MNDADSAERNARALEAQPYKSPAAIGAADSGSVGRTRRFVTGAFVLSLAAVLAPLSICTLAILGLITVSWDSIVVPAVNFFGGLALAVTALVVAVVARVRQRAPLATAAILLAVIAFPICLATSWMLAMIGLANHPV